MKQSRKNVISSVFLTAAAVCLCVAWAYVGFEMLAYVAARLHYKRYTVREGMFLGAIVCHSLDILLSTASTFMSAGKGGVWVVINTLFLCMGIVGLAWSIFALCIL